MDIWGHCPDCRRWFYCGRQSGGASAGRPASRCPVCGLDPSEVAYGEVPQDR